MESVRTARAGWFGGVSFLSVPDRPGLAFEKTGGWLSLVGCFGGGGTEKSRERTTDGGGVLSVVLSWCEKN